MNANPGNTRILDIGAAVRHAESLERKISETTDDEIRLQLQEDLREANEAAASLTNTFVDEVMEDYASRRVVKKGFKQKMREKLASLFS